MRILSLMAAMAMCFALACKTPAPINNPGNSTPIAPQNNAEVMDTVANVLSWALPGAAAITRLLPIDAAAKDVVVRALDRATDALPAVRRAIATYRERGGGAGVCELHAASGALRELLKGVARAMFASGYSFATEIEGVLTAIGAVVDDFAPRCTPDAGFYSAAADDASSLRALATRAEVELGHPLRPFPPIPREGAR